MFYSIIQDNLKIGSYTVTEKELEGRKYLVVPVTMIVEGVLNGSQGPLLHLAGDFGKIPESWNGIPIVINHPELNGNGISANSPEVIEAGKVGTIFYSHIEDNKLKAEAWLDAEKLGRISVATMSAINALTAIEVSVGVFTENEAIAGMWNGTKYNAIARNHRPDHLALLPDGTGACSLKDGCGITSNESKEVKGGNNVDRLEAIQLLKNEGIRIYEVQDNSSKGLNEKLDELRNLIRALNPAYVEGQYSEYNYLIEAYDNYLIYQKDIKDGCKYFKQNYQFSVTDGKAEFVGDPVEVEKKVDYESIIETNEKNKEVKSMSEVTKCTPCIEKKATELIVNKATKFTEADRGWLETFEESQLNKMIPEEVVPVENKLSAEDQAALDFGKKVLAKKKADMAAGIQKNTEAGTWTDAELETMSEGMLEKLYKSTVKENLPADYTLNGGVAPIVNNSGKREPMVPNV